jgi:hypothetical protein
MPGIASCLQAKPDGRSIADKLTDSRQSLSALRSARRVARGMTHALDDHGILGNAIKDEVGLRADQHAPHACKIGLLSDMRMLNEESRDALHPLADATGALRRFQRDAVDDLF